MGDTVAVVGQGYMRDKEGTVGKRFALEHNEVSLLLGKLSNHMGPFHGAVDVWNLQVLHHFVEHVDIVALQLAFVVEIGVGRKLPVSSNHQWALLRIFVEGA